MHLAGLAAQYKLMLGMWVWVCCVCCCLRFEDGTCNAAVQDHTAQGHQDPASPADCFRPNIPVSKGAAWTLPVHLDSCNLLQDVAGSQGSACDSVQPPMGGKLCAISMSRKGKVCHLVEP